ncbi:hypothetical protein SK128_024282 [Halocaridina rubra]|uniref:Uncharacterized protein n=1 Tax=Halocaridina rubra TaxID=373956 RepID=A0AAN8XHJ3_HALRR
MPLPFSLFSTNGSGNKNAESQTSVMFLLLALAAVAFADKSEEQHVLQTLSNFEGLKNGFRSSAGKGTYSFIYHIGDSERAEERDEGEAPEDTDDVKKAKEEFFQAYQKALELAEEDDYEYSEESYESEESSEESSEEDSNEDDDDEEEDEEEKEEEEGNHIRASSHFGFRVPYPYNRK